MAIEPPSPEIAKASRGLSTTIEILILIIIALMAVLIILSFRAWLADQSIGSFEDCKKLHGTVHGNPYQCKTINGDTYEIEP